MVYLYQNNPASMKDGDSLDPNTTDDTDDEGPMVPEEDFEKDETEENEEDSY